MDDMYSEGTYKMRKCETAKVTNYKMHKVYVKVLSQFIHVHYEQQITGHLPAMAALSNGT